MNEFIKGIRFQEDTHKQKSEISRINSSFMISQINKNSQFLTHENKKYNLDSEMGMQMTL